MIRLPEHVRRRRLRLILFVLSTGVSILLACWLFTADIGTNAGDLAGVVGMFTGLWSLVAALAQFLPPPPPPPDAAEAADQLAVTVREQWSEEVGARQLRDPAVIPLSWAGTSRPVSVPPESVVGPHAGRVRRLSLDGRLEGSFDHAASQLAAGFRQVPSGRLVVLGEPGSGKTVLAIMLTLGLLADRTAGTPVPVMLSVSGWDPVMESLDDFIVGSLSAAYYGGHPQIPRLLLERRMLLPVLDGLDEMPEAARRNAVRGLNDACGDGRGVVVTCRSVEYQDVIEGGSPPLRKAAVVEVAPVSVPDVIAYLRDVNWPEGVDWEPVYTHLRRHPESPVATALSTPLALSLARGVYRNCDRDPRELLDLDGRHAIEDHLVDHTILAAYAPPPGTLPQQADSGWQENAQKAEKWLTFLATYLHQHRERDLAWWKMSSRLLSRRSKLLVALATGLAVTPFLEEESWFAGGVITLLWYVVPEQRPGRISFSRRGSLHRLRGGFRTGFALTSPLAAIVLIFSGFVITLDIAFEGMHFPVLLGIYKFIAWTAAPVIAIGLAFAVHSWLDVPPERSTHAAPRRLIQQDRNSSFVAAVLAGAVLAVSLIVLFFPARTVAYLAFVASTNPSGMAPITEILFNEKIGNDPSFSVPDMQICISIGIIFMVAMLTPRAWMRFTLLRFALASRRKLPWGLIRFLDDARNRQLLRQSNGVYQFRHIRLQERLASQSLAQNRVTTPRPSMVRRYRFQIALTVTAFLAGFAISAPDDNSDIVLPTGDVEQIAFGPEGTLFAVGSDGIVQRWDTETGKKIGTDKVEYLPGVKLHFSMGARKDGVTLVATSKDGIEVVAKIPDDNSAEPDYLYPPGGEGREGVKAWTYSDAVKEIGFLTLYGKHRAGMALKDLGYIGKESSTSKLKSVAFASDTALINSSDGGLQVRHIDKSLKSCTIPGKAGLMGIDGTGKKFATVSSEKVSVWDGECRKEDHSIVQAGTVEAIALDAEGTKLAVNVDGGETRVFSLS